MMKGSKPRCLKVLVLTGLILLFGSGSVSAASEAACPGKTDPYPESVRNMPPITFVRNGDTMTVSLCEAFDFHGNACPGATMAFMAVRYGFELLYRGEIPSAEDLVITGDPRDLLPLIGQVMGANDID